MKKPIDPRLDATRTQALEAALSLLQEKGALAVTHAAISCKTQISRSTLYRHWPTVEGLRHAAFARATLGPAPQHRNDGPLWEDLRRMIGQLMTALNDTPWGKIAPQIIAMAATEEQTQELMRNWIKDRSHHIKAVFVAAKARGELREDARIDQLIEMAISVPYFRKLIAGLPLDHHWLRAHVDMVCAMATKKSAIEAKDCAKL